MKIRFGFISNSSSCSYMCEVCHETIAGYDVSFIDYELFQCATGHVFHEDCTSNFEEKRKAALLQIGKKRKEEFGLDEEELNDADLIEDYVDEFRYECPRSMCPVCSFEHLSTDDELQYYRRKFGYDPKKILQGIRDDFDSYDEFWNYLKGKPKTVTCKKSDG